MALSYSLQISFMLGLTEGSWVVISTPAFSLLWYVILVEIEDNMSSEWYVDGKWRSILIVFSRKLWIFFFYPTPSISTKVLRRILNHWTTREVPESFKILENCPAHGGGYNFSETCVLVWKSTFYHWQRILSVGFLEVIGSLYSFLRRCVLNTQVWTGIACLSVLFSRGNGVLWKRLSCHLTDNHTSTFSQNNHWTIILGRRALCLLPISSHKILKYLC